MTAHPAPLKVGVAGVGVMGRNHARVLSRHPRLRPGAIFDLDAVTAQGVADAL